MSLTCLLIIMDYLMHNYLSTKIAMKQPFPTRWTEDECDDGFTFYVGDTQGVVEDKVLRLL